MKRIWCFVTAVFLIVLVCTGCSEKDSKTVKADLPYGEDIGDGFMYLIDASGTTKDGEVLRVLLNKDTIMTQIGLNTFSFDGSCFSFIYVDGVFSDKQPLSDSQFSLTLQGDMLSEGEHTVSVVQYKDNTESGEIVTYKEAIYAAVY